MKWLIDYKRLDRFSALIGFPTSGGGDKECPSEGIISEAENGILEKKKQRTANALSVKDLEKLNEEELKLLPLKDFWDATKKVWKKNGFGTFAKRNSATMKKFLD